jgi:hypothetical protein
MTVFKSISFDHQTSWRTSNGKTANMKVVCLEKLGNFVVYNFFI